MAKKLQVEIVGDASSLQRAFGSASKSSSTFGDAMAKGARISTAALGGLAVGAGFALKSAVDLGEQMSKSGIVFGSAGKDVQAWSKTLASSFGISQVAALEAAGTFGNMLVPMGIARTKAADMSKGMIELAADMASFNNASPEATLEALRSGLAGEAEPLRKFGVFLNEARIKQEALNLGLYNGKGALSAASKAQATYAIITRDSRDAQGDFGRTSDSLANRQRILKAELTNVSSQLGTSLIPLATKAAEVIARFTDFASKHTTAVKIVAAALGALAIAQLAVNVAMSLNPVVIVIAGLAALGAALVIAYQRSETFRNIVNGVFNAVRNAAATFISFYLGVVDKFLGGIQKMAEIASKLPFIGDKFKGIASAVGNARENVRSLQSAIDGLKSKEITITTNLRTYGSTAADPSLGVIGRRAHGGPVGAGRPYIVGERGPELFVPGSSGAIVPNGGARGGGGGDIVIQVDGETLWRVSKKYALRDMGRNVSTGIA